MASYSPAPTAPPPVDRQVTLQEPGDGASYHGELDYPEPGVEAPMMQGEIDPVTGLPRAGENTNQQNNVQVPGMEEQPAPTGFLAWGGFGLSIFSLMSLCIAFASPYWWQTWPNSFNTFLNIGLWEVCFRNYMHHKDDSQEIYDGCWWVFSTDARYHKLREWLLPPWFITCQVIVTGCLLIQLAVCVLIALIFLHCCPIMNHEYHQTYGMFSAAALLFLSSISSVVVGVIFGIRCQDREWMPRPDLNLLSWGYGFFIISAIVSLGAGIMFFLEARKVHNELMRREDEFLKAAIEASGYPSQSQYSIDPGYNQPGYYTDKPSYGTQQSYEKPLYGDEKQSYHSQQSYDKQPYDSGPGAYDTQPSYEKQPYPSQSSYDPDYSYDNRDGGQAGYNQYPQKQI